MLMNTAQVASFLALYKYKYDYMYLRNPLKSHIWQMRIVSSLSSDVAGLMLLTNCVTKQLHKFPRILCGIKEPFQCTYTCCIRDLVPQSLISSHILLNENVLLFSSSSVVEAFTILAIN